jgi:hypothetical protein
MHERSEAKAEAKLVTIKYPRGNFGNDTASQPPSAIAIGDAERARARANRANLHTATHNAPATTQSRIFPTCKSALAAT